MTVAYDAQSASAQFLSTAAGTFTHTPVGTPRGVIVPLGQTGSAGDQVTSVTYGGVAMSRIDMAVDSAGEIGRSYLYFLGSGIPTGAQSVVPTIVTGDLMCAWCLTLTAAGDTQVAAHNTASGDAANPSLTLATLAGFVGFVGGVLFSGQNAPASITAGTGYTLLTTTNDLGNQSVVCQRSDTRTGANVAFGFTALIEDVAMCAVAINEIVTAKTRAGFVNYQDPGWMFRGLRSNWNRRRSGLLVPDYSF